MRAANAASAVNTKLSESSISADGGYSTTLTLIAAGHKASTVETEPHCFEVRLLLYSFIAACFSLNRILFSQVCKLLFYHIVDNPDLLIMMDECRLHRID